MTIRFRCSCGRRLRAPEDMVGKRAICPKCGEKVRVPEPPEPKPSGPPKGEVLISDSNPRDQMLTINMLEEFGFKVYVADDGENAVQLIRAACPDVCMLDLNTKRLGAFQVISAIQDDMNTKNRDVWRTPFVITGDGLTSRDRGFAKALNVKHCFSKPLGASQVCKALEQVIKERHHTVRPSE